MKSDPRILELGPDFYDEVKPAAFPKAIVRFRNETWAERVGLGGFDDESWIRHFGRFEPLGGNLSIPLALRYHGHQFRSYNPDIGDGRGFLYAQLRETSGDRLLDLGTKGSGQTPWSRRGDGRLTLKGAMREALATEMLESLGVYTSKTFSVIETGEALQRNDEPSPTRSAVLTRLSHGHIRIGTFQRFAYLEQPNQIEKLLRYCVRHYYPELGSIEDTRALAAAFLGKVATRSADLTASWMIAGFVHGVLNTDNLSITGESFDYGPYRFLPYYDPAFTAAYFDTQGLYCYARQPESVFWNLHQLAIALASLFPEPQKGYDEALVPVLEKFEGQLGEAMRPRFVRRLNLKSRGAEIDAALLSTTFDFLMESRCSFEGFFFDWFGGKASKARALTGTRGAIYTGELFEAFLRSVEVYELADEARLAHAYFDRENPSMLIIDEIEAIWSAIDKNDDWAPFTRKVEEIRSFRGLWG